ncbi:thyrotroph embryonic factor isoform X8 [Phlebotomus papatasi]|uniref:thyrotroph embryonic factor isoform X8 n=1 Tax=Phlebotomus papatasi TaxID=29031 RepID=UPI0024833B34|nr:thyrotroph embryonic factor isoform X8 [Phlebotomus papatasi]
MKSRMGEIDSFYHPSASASAPSAGYFHQQTSIGNQCWTMMPSGESVPNCTTSLAQNQFSGQKLPWNFSQISPAAQSGFSGRPYDHYGFIAGTQVSPGPNDNLSHQPAKRYLPISGKSGNSKDICGDDKHKEDGDPWNVEAQAAFLGPNLWDKTLPYDADLKYVDLDEFLSENNIPVDGLPGGHLGHSNGLGHRSDSLGHSTGLSLGLSQVTTKRERSPSPSDCVSPDTMNPPSPAESNEELKPQPMIKKSRKQFVPEELKDDKYWARRRKNNIAAKRSRDARRQKENQIAMRARYLEKENMSLQQEVDQLRQENLELRSRLSKYQEV